MPETTLFDDRVQALLAAREIAVLATLQPSGAPLAMAMWFVHDRDSLTMISQASTQKVRNLRRDPRASGVVESADTEGLRGVSIQGAVAFLDDPTARAPHLGRPLRTLRGPACPHLGRPRGAPRPGHVPPVSREGVSHHVVNDGRTHARNDLNPPGVASRCLAARGKGVRCASGC